MWQICFFPPLSLSDYIHHPPVESGLLKKSLVCTLNSLQTQRRLIDYVKIGKEKKKTLEVRITEIHFKNIIIQTDLKVKLIIQSPLSVRCHSH